MKFLSERKVVEKGYESYSYMFATMEWFNGTIEMDTWEDGEMADVVYDAKPTEEVRTYVDEQCLEYEERIHKRQKGEKRRIFIVGPLDEDQAMLFRIRFSEYIDVMRRD
ncbi:hypothetical protein [Noviherbaspirillum sp.]|uniref:hypothetical protein n=1 Tax=Noviherbaspirillum sp. TaxID=1926288 RepID=UPI002FE22576